MAQPSNFVTAPRVAFAIAGVAAACGVYAVYARLHSASAGQDTLHRSNAIRQARGQRPQVEIGLPDEQTPLGRVIIRRGSTRLATSMATLRSLTEDEVTRVFGSQHAHEAYEEAVAIGIHALLLCCSVQRPAQREAIVEMGLGDLHEALESGETNRCVSLLAGESHPYSRL
jgi:hypothetical protein